MIVLRTERLSLREFELHDAAFALELLNEPGFHRFIGDKGVRTLDDAREYLKKGPIESYRQNGFGLLAVGTADPAGDTLVGMCGMVRREGLSDPDIGYAFLSRHWGNGFAVEAAAAVFEHATRVLKLPRILAITSPDNLASIRVLEKIGLKFDRLMRLKDDASEVKLFRHENPSVRP